MSYLKFSKKLFGPTYDMWMHVARFWNEGSSGKTCVLAEKPFARLLSTINSTSTALNVNRVSLLQSRRLFTWVLVLPYLSSHLLPVQRRRYDKSVYIHKIVNITTHLPFFLMKFRTSVSHSSPTSVLDLVILKNLHILKTNYQSTQQYFILCSLIIYSSSCFWDTTGWAPVQLIKK
jgi:hypothetical protein